MASPRRFDVTPETQARLQVIYEQVRRSLAENVATIDAAISLLATSALDEPDRKAAERAAHRLVGAAETIGFPEATAPARRLESAFASDRVRADGVPLLRIDTAALRRILAAGDVPDQRVSTGSSGLPQGLKRR